MGFYSDAFSALTMSSIRQADTSANSNINLTVPEEGVYQVNYNFIPMANTATTIDRGAYVEFNGTIDSQTVAVGESDCHKSMSGELYVRASGSIAITPRSVDMKRSSFSAIKVGEVDNG